jgi:hypothetical protein
VVKALEYMQPGGDLLGRLARLVFEQSSLITVWVALAA